MRLSPFFTVLQFMHLLQPILLGILVSMLTGCLFGGSSEIKRAEEILTRFECHNVESQNMLNSPLNSYHQQLLGSSKHKAQDYVERYQQGEHLFELPLDEIIQQQYELYVTACENLGGLPLEKLNRQH